MKSSLFHRIIRTKAKALKLSEDEVLVIVKRVTGHDRIEDIDGSGEANAVLEAIKAPQQELLP